MIALVSENEPFHQTSCEQEGQQRTTELFCSFVFQSGKPVILFPRQPGLSCLANEPDGGIPAGRYGPTCASGRDNVATNKQRAADSMANVGPVRLA